MFFLEVENWIWMGKHSMFMWKVSAMDRILNALMEAYRSSVESGRGTLSCLRVVLFYRHLYFSERADPWISIQEWLWDVISPRWEQSQCRCISQSDE